MITLKHENWVIEDVDAIIFDKDGTITDVHVYWGEIIKMRAEKLVQRYYMPSMYSCLLEYDMGYNRAAKKLMSDGPIALVGRNEVIEIITRHLCNYGANATENDVSEIFNSVHAQFTKTKIDECIKILPGVEDFIKSLNNHQFAISDVLLFLLTSDTKVNAIKGMYKLGMYEYFLGIYGKEDSKEDKITGGICKGIIEKHKISYNNVVAIGDTNTDIYMARNAGIKACIGVATGQVPLGRLETIYKCNSLSEIQVIKE